VAAGIGLDIPLDRDFGELGPAHRQLVAIARAVAADASVLIFDEPTATLASAEAVRRFGKWFLPSPPMSDSCSRIPPLMESAKFSDPIP
jgi:ABC-type molybdenum transport system ATPase subunit/photorepair protein PhrA